MSKAGGWGSDFDELLMFELDEGCSEANSDDEDCGSSLANGLSAQGGGANDSTAEELVEVAES